MRIRDVLRIFAGGVNVGWNWAFGWTGYTRGEVMLITVTRTNKSTDGIFGTLVIDANSFKCVTLENLALAIPAGSYPVLYRWSPDFQQIMPHIIVPNRTDIMVHWANWPKQLLGCISLGTELDFQDDMITESKKAWIGFVQAITDQPSLTLKVTEDYGPVASV